jgi:hypothetical protein
MAAPPLDSEEEDELSSTGGLVFFHDDLELLLPEFSAFLGGGGDGDGDGEIFLPFLRCGFES